MHKETLEKAAFLAHGMGNVFIATSDDLGTPHISVLQPVGLDAQGRLELTGWLVNTQQPFSPAVFGVYQRIHGTYSFGFRDN